VHLFSHVVVIDSACGERGLMAFEADGWNAVKQLVEGDQITLKFDLTRSQPATYNVVVRQALLAARHN
jgi:hypothetical protein